MILTNKLAALGTVLSDRLTAAFDPLSPSAASILLTLSCWGDLTATNIAQIVGIAQPTAVRVIAGLVKSGLVTNKVSESRAVPFSLTATGRRKASEMQSRRIAAARSLIESLPKNRIGAFEECIDQLLASATDSRRRARISCRFCDHRSCAGSECPVGTRAAVLEGRLEIQVKHHG